MTKSLVWEGPKLENPAHQCGQSVGCVIMKSWIRLLDWTVHCVLEQGTSFHVGPVYSVKNEYQLSTGATPAVPCSRTLSVPLGEGLEG